MNRPSLQRSSICAFLFGIVAYFGSPTFALAGLTINARFVGGKAPANMVGGGNLPDVFKAAAARWEAAFRDRADHWVVNLEYRWTNMGDGSNARFDLGRQGGSPHRILSGQILFNNSGSTAYFADPTPRDDSEYGGYEEVNFEEPVGVINVGRQFTRPRGHAVGHIDLLTIAAHEIGHALGLAAGNTALMGQFEITPPRPYAGLTVYTGGGSHLLVGTALMGGIFFDSDHRVLISVLDVLAIAEISQFADPNLDPYADPRGCVYGHDGGWNPGQEAPPRPKSPTRPRSKK